MKEFAFYFGLTFRIIFYTFFLSQILFPKQTIFFAKRRKLLNTITLFFGICYISYYIPKLFDGKNYGGSIKSIITILILFFLWLFFYINVLQLKKISIKNKTTEQIILTLILMVIAILNPFFNYHSYHGTWFGDYVSEFFHAIFSFLAPIFAFLARSVSPLNKKFGILILVLTITQFIFGVSLSYGIDGYLSNDTEFSILFISNTLILFFTGLYYTIESKKPLPIN